MNISSEHIDQLIVRCLSKEASVQEIQALEEWKAFSEENRSYFAEMQFIYDTSAKIVNTKPVDVNGAWNKVKAQMAGAEAKVVPIYPSKNEFAWSKWAVAASVMLVFSIGMVWFSGSQTQPMQISSNHKAAKSELEDGSTVELAAHTKLKQIKKGKREYELEGEATFTVSHDDANPFIIHTDDVMIKDVGTVFKVSYLPQNDTVRVNVTEGVVQFYSAKNEGIMLQQGESGYYLRSDKKFYRLHSLSPADVPRMNVSFDDQTLNEVVNELNKSFKARFVIESEAIRDCRITVNFKDASLDDIKEIIAETLDISASERDGKIILRGRGCF